MPLWTNVRRPQSALPASGPTRHAAAASAATFATSGTIAVDATAVPSCVRDPIAGRLHAPWQQPSTTRPESSAHSTTRPTRRPIPADRAPALATTISSAVATAVVAVASASQPSAAPAAERSLAASTALVPAAFTASSPTKRR